MIGTCSASVNYFQCLCFPVFLCTDQVTVPSQWHHSGSLCFQRERNCHLSEQPWHWCHRWNLIMSQFQLRPRPVFVFKRSGFVFFLIQRHWGQPEAVQEHNGEPCSAVQAGPGFSFSSMVRMVTPVDPGRAPLAPKLFSKLCSFQAILRNDALFWTNFGLRGLPWGQNSAGPPWPKSWICPWVNTTVWSADTSSL